MAAVEALQPVAPAQPDWDTGRSAVDGVLDALALGATTMTVFADGDVKHNLSPTAIVGAKVKGDILLQCVGEELATSQLEELHLPRQGITQDGAIVLARIIRTSKTLRTLSLTYNSTLGDEGAIIIATALVVAPESALATLNVNRCGIGAAGAKALADAVQHRERLGTLQVNSNKVGDAGAHAMASALASSGGRLRHLGLASNRITNAGACSLADVLRRINRGLRELELHNNKVGREGLEELSAAMMSNTVMTRLSLQGNSDGDPLTNVINNGPLHPAMHPSHSWLTDGEPIPAYMAMFGASMPDGEYVHELQQLGSQAAATIRTQLAINSRNDEVHQRKEERTRELREAMRATWALCRQRMLHGDAETHEGAWPIANKLCEVSDDTFPLIVLKAIPQPSVCY